MAFQFGNNNLVSIPASVSAPATTTATFGMNFGAPAASTSAAFAPVANASTTTGFGGFGTTTTTTTTNPSSAPAFGAFGTTAPTTTFGGLGSTTFGATTATTTAGFGTFGMTGTAPATTTTMNPLTTTTFGKPLVGSLFSGSTAGNSTATTQLGSFQNPANQQEPTELNGQTMEQLVSTWNREQAEQLKTFRECEEQIAEWDERCLQNQTEIYNLKQQVFAMERAKDAINNMMARVEAEFKYLENLVVTIENSFESDGLASQIADLERKDRTYVNVDRVRRDLEHSRLHIMSMLQDLRKARGHSSGKQDISLRNIENIMNEQLDKLNHIEQLTEILQQMLAECEPKLREIQAAMAGRFQQ